MSKSVREKLCELYPNGLVLGNAYGIVGPMGLTVNWANETVTQEEKFKEDDKVSIIRHELHKVEISAKGKSAIIPTSFLKGIILHSIPDEPEAPILSRNLLDEAGLWENNLQTAPEGGEKEGV